MSRKRYPRTPNKVSIKRTTSPLRWFIGKLLYLPNIILYTIFIVILFVGALSLILAYTNLVIENRAIVYSLERVRESIDQVFITTVGEPKSQFEAESFLKYLTDKSSNDFQLNITNFLFQLFSVALISVGVYLLNRSYENNKRLKNIITSYHYYIDSFPVMQNLHNIVMHLYLTTNIAKSQGDNLLISTLLPDVRDWINIDLVKLKDELIKLSPLEVPVYEINFHRNAQKKIRSNLVDIQKKLNLSLSKEITNFISFSEVFESSVSDKNYREVIDELDRMETEIL